MAVIQDIRDVVLIVVAIVWSFVYLGILAVTAVAGVLLVRYLGKAQELIEQQGGPLLDTVQGAIESARARTASLPHYGAGEGVEPERATTPYAIRRSSQLKLSLPFFRRKKPWYERLLGR
jgi:hypothetical protein